MLPCVWLLIPDLVASLTIDNDGDAREEDHATHGSDKSKLTLDFLHGTLLVIVVGGGRNDPAGYAYMMMMMMMMMMSVK